MSEFEKDTQAPQSGFGQNEQAPEQQGYQAPPPGYQPPPQGYQSPPPGYQTPPQYGAPPQYGQPMYAPEKPLHVPSIVLGIVGIILLWFTIGIAGVVCGIIGFILAKRAQYEYRSTVGFVLSLISLIIGIIILILVIVAIAAVGIVGLGALAML